ncbi:MAG: Holliday junction resolvase RuvX [Oscillospiraceae bacterium]
MKIMSVDFGDARTGLAMCDKTEFLASPIGVVHEKRFDFAVEKTAAAAIENKAEAIIVGLPLNMNGSEGPRAELCREFAARLGEKVTVPVRMWDERQTTVSAAGYLNETDTRGKKRKAVIDAVAAVIILESYLQWRKNHPGEF